MLQLILTFLISSSPALAEDFPLTPDPKVTYGDLCDFNDPDYRGRRYEEKIPICVRAVSYETKQRIYAIYGIPENCRREYTIDHFIPLSIGGSNAPENLWPEHRNVKATRQTLEQDIYDQLRRGEIKQLQAISELSHAKMNPSQPEPSDCK